MRNRTLDLQNELSQHLIQLEGIIHYLEVDLAENQQFTANNEIISSVLWSASTLAANARKTLENLEIEMKQASHKKGDTL